MNSFWNGFEKRAVSNAFALKHTAGGMLSRSGGNSGLAKQLGAMLNPSALSHASKAAPKETLKTIREVQKAVPKGNASGALDGARRLIKERTE